MTKAPKFCQRAGKGSPSEPESNGDMPEKGLQKATHEVVHDFWAQPQAVCARVRS